MKRLQDKVTIVFGGGQQPGEGIGNGRAISMLFAREGAKVVVVDLHLASAEETVELIKKEGGEACAVRADITNAEDCQAVVAATIDRYHRIDILVNNVGIVHPADGGIETISETAWEKVQEVNLKGPLLASKYVLPVMVKQQCGSIINISSMAALTRSANRGPVGYITSKAAVNALTEYLAMNYAAEGIRVNAIMPGLMKTPVGIEPSKTKLGISSEEVVNLRNASVPLKGGMGDAWDTAYAALFLASDEAKFITGVALPVDGGQTTKRG